MIVNVEMRYGVNLQVDCAIVGRKICINKTSVNGAPVKVDMIELMPDLKEAMLVQREVAIETKFLKKSKR